MTFPSVVAYGTASAASSVSSRAPGYPAGVVAGQILCTVITIWDATVTLTGYSGWTLESTTAHSNSYDTYILWKVADGTESGTFSFTFSGTAGYAQARMFNVSGASDVETAGAAVVSTSCDAPNLSPSWGAADTLWYCYNFAQSGGMAAAPTGYSGRTDMGTSGTQYSQGSYKTANAASENPAAVSCTNSNWCGVTIAFRPTTLSSGLFFGSNF